LHYDLSRTSYSYRCLEVYKPIFDDVHNLKEINQEIGFIKPSEAEKSFYCSYFAHYKSYYGPAVLREFTNGEIRKLGGWCNLSQDARVRFAKERALKHNKHIIYKKTFVENCETLLSYTKLCHEHKIRVVIVIMPFAEEYIKYIDMNYKKILLEQLAALPYEVEFVDLNDANCFDVCDFIDSDHLSDIGAKKVTTILGEYII